MSRPKDKDNMRLRIRDVLEEETYDPLREVLRSLKNKKLKITDAERLKANLELCSYVFPKMKSIELEGKMKQEFSFVIQNFGHILNEREARALPPGPVEIVTTQPETKS